MFIRSLATVSCLSILAINAIAQPSKLYMDSVQPVGLACHASHAHQEEKIILFVAGVAEMQTGRTFSSMKPGAVVFVSSNVPHALKNTGTGPCVYLAFQWQ